MYIYEFEFDKDYIDWVFAPNIKEAKSFYLSFTGCGCIEDYKISRVPKKKWASLFILDINEYCEDVPEDEEDNYHGGYKIEMTLEEYAAKNTQTDMICTTVF